MRRNFAFLGAGLAWAMALGGMQGCTCAPATVDLVQPNAVEKSVFASGEWYFRNAVAEVPYGTTTSFTGAQTSMERIRWKIEEHALIGYRSYENVEDTDISVGIDVDEDGEYYGSPIIAYRIESHFDIRRSYSRSTGEEYNVIEENHERPWFEREFMRIDWSRNIATPVLAFTFGGVRMSYSNYYPENPSDSLAPKFDDSNADGIIDSIFLHTKVWAEPSTTYYPGYGFVPQCLFYGQAYFECSGAEVTIASSFLRVDPAREYSGLPYDSRWMRTFGYFNTMRLTYDRRYAIPEANRVWYANRHNIWGEWFQKNAEGEIMCSGELPDGSTRSGPCNTFTQFENPKPLMLRYNDRPVRKIPYHVNTDYDERLLPVTIDIANGWNEPFRDTVNSLRYWECLEEGGTDASCQSVVDPNLSVFVLCPNNPSQPGDPEECSTDHTGPGGVPDGIPDEATIGDLRYHFIYLVPNPFIASPFGYGPSAADPKGTDIALANDNDPNTPDVLRLGSGEIINSTAYVYSHALDRVATGVADLVELINGNLDPEEFVDGENVEDWVNSLWGTDFASGETFINPDDAFNRMAGGTWGRSEKGLSHARAPGEAEYILGTMDSSWSTAIRAEAGYTGMPSRPEELAGFWEDMNTAIDSSGIFGGGAAEVRTNWETLKDSPFDDVLWNDETIGIAGFDPSAVDMDDLSDISPLDVVDPKVLEEKDYWDMVAGMNAVCLDDSADFTDPTLLGLAMSYANSGMTYDEIWNDVRTNTYRGVMEHEIGHTVGLRHNFAASYDAFNYFPEYWELRNDGNMGPRHIDPETPAEIMGREREYMYSSVMDYHASRNSDWKGLGRYDKAAIKFGYGLLVEAMTAVPAGTAIAGLDNNDALGWISYFNGTNVYPTVSGLVYTNGDWLEMHYTDYPAIAGDLESRVNVPLDKYGTTASDAAAAEGGYDTGFGDMLVIGENVPGVVSEGMPAAPYRFCSDEFAFGMTCARFDEGADPYEVTNYYIQKYYNYYLLNNFKRGRYGFRTSSGYLSGVWGRYLAPLSTWARYYVLFHSIFGAETDDGAAGFFAADKGYGGWTIGMNDTFQFLMNIVMRPEPGEYVSTYRADGSLYNVTTTGTGDFTLPLVTAGYYTSTWDFDAGYYWYDMQTRIGTFYDKLLALQALTRSSTYGFSGQDVYSDPRSYALSYADIWQGQIALFLGQLMTDERLRYSPVHMGGGEIMYPDVIDTTRTWPPAGMESDVVRPGAYWYVHYIAGLYGMALLSRGFDHTFLDRSRIYRLGNGETVTPPAGVSVVTFTDPVSGLSWQSWSYPAEDKLGNVLLDTNGLPIELGSGARMLRRANALVDLCDLTVIAPYTDPTDPEELDYQRYLACTDLDQYTNDIKNHADAFNYLWAN